MEDVTIEVIIPGERGARVEGEDTLRRALSIAEGYLNSGRKVVIIVVKDD